MESRAAAPAALACGDVAGAGKSASSARAAAVPLRTAASSVAGNAAYV